LAEWPTPLDNSSDFIVWLMDYTGRDVIYCEGESTGWNWGERIPPGMENETDRAHADRLQTGMLRQLVEGMKHELTWRLSPYPVYPLPHHCLAQAWFSMYYDGLDPLTGLEVTDFPVLIPDGEGLSRAMVDSTYDRKTDAFALRSDRPLPAPMCERLRRRRFFLRVAWASEESLRREIEWNLRGPTSLFFSPS